MLPQKFPRIGATLLVLCLLLNACNIEIPGKQAVKSSSSTFQSDQQLEITFQNHAAEFSQLLKLVQNCEKQAKQIKNDTSSNANGGIAFFTCPVDVTQLNPLGLKEVARGTASKPVSNDPKVLSILFIANQARGDSWSTFVEEKGYIYSAQPIQEGLVEKDTLDQFMGKMIIDIAKNREVWKYKKIGDGWYLYFRQFYRDALP